MLATKGSRCRSRRPAASHADIQQGGAALGVELRVLTLQSRRNGAQVLVEHEVATVTSMEMIEPTIRLMSVAPRWRTERRAGGTARRFIGSAPGCPADQTGRLPAELLSSSGVDSVMRVTAESTVVIAGSVEPAEAG